MKSNKIIIAALMVVVATAVAFVSCKKENQDAMLNTSQPVKAFTVPQIDDMNAYLKEFKQRMQTSKSDEVFSLKEAAWHLSCLANTEFCRINVKYDDFQFDTVVMQVNVSNGVMLMNDICVAYEQMCAEIQQFKKGFDQPEQNLFFIKVSINADGNAKIALMTSYCVYSKDLYNHTWYFQDVFEALDVCNEYYSPDSVYTWNGLGATELERVLNLFEHHENGPSSPGGHSVMCYIPTRNADFDYTNTYDPYDETFYYINGSRVFAVRKYEPIQYYNFTVWEICYLLDSYLGLGYDYIADHLYVHEFPVNWTIRCFNPHTSIKWEIYHQLHVEYGRAITVDPPTPND